MVSTRPSCLGRTSAGRLRLQVLLYILLHWRTGQASLHALIGGVSTPEASIQSSSVGCCEEMRGTALILGFDFLLSLTGMVDSY
jgi:hypothetical protein